MKKRDGAGRMRARRYAFYAQKPASVEEGRRTGGGPAEERRRFVMPAPRGQLIISWFLLRNQSKYEQAHRPRPVRCTRTHPHSRPRGRCFIDTYDGTLSGRSCFKPQRDLTEKRHTLSAISTPVARDFRPSEPLEPASSLSSRLLHPNFIVNRRKLAVLETYDSV